MIRHKILESETVAGLKDKLNNFLFNLNVYGINDVTKILFVTQSETFLADQFKWHGTVTIIYQSKEEILTIE